MEVILKSKRGNAVILLLVVLALLAGLVYFFFVQAKLSTTSLIVNPQNTNVPTRNGYSSYSNPTYGVTFEYPSKWGKAIENPTIPEGIDRLVGYNIGFSDNYYIGITKGQAPWWLYDETIEYIDTEDLKRNNERIESEDKGLLINSKIGDTCGVPTNENCKVVEFGGNKAIERYISYGGLSGSISVKIYTFYNKEQRYDINLVLYLDIPGYTSDDNWQEYSDILEKTKNGTAPESVMTRSGDFDEFVKSIKFI